MVQKHARRDPRRGELHEIARRDERQHRGEREAKPRGESPLARFAVEVVRRITRNHPADERDEQQHRDADRIHACR